MARLLTTGLELGDVVAEPTPSGVPVVQAGTPIVQSTRKRTGTYALQFQGGDHLRFGSMGTTSAEPYFHRVYWDFEAWPTTGGTGLHLQGRPSGYTARISSTGVISLYHGSTLIGSGLQLALDTQYCVEVKTQINTAAGSDDTGELRVDAVSIASETNVNRATVASGNFDLGSGTADATFEAYADDIAVNDGQGSNQNSWPGKARIVMAKPKADSAVGTGWEAPQTTGSDTTNLYDAVDNTPAAGVAHSDVDANNLKYVFNVASDASTNLDFTMQDYDEVGVPSTATISLVQALCRGGSDSATLTAGAIDLVSNPDQGTETTIASWDLANVVAATDPTGWNTFEALAVHNPSVTRATDPVVRVGKRTATTRAVMVDLVGLYIEYIESTVTNVNVGLASEVDTANSLGKTKSRALPLAAELDTAMPMGRSKNRATGLATEADTAQPIGKIKNRTPGLITELDTANPIGRTKSKPTGLATETDTALPIGKIKNRSPGLAPELDTAFPFGKIKTKAVGLAGEVDTALPMTEVKNRAVGLATETDTALPIGHTKTKDVGLATETDTAQPIGVTTSGGSGGAARDRLLIHVGE